MRVGDAFGFARSSGSTVVGAGGSGQHCKNGSSSLDLDIGFQFPGVELAGRGEASVVSEARNRPRDFVRLAAWNLSG